MSTRYIAKIESLPPGEGCVSFEAESNFHQAPSMFMSGELDKFEVIDIDVDGHSQLFQKDFPAYLFTAPARMKFQDGKKLNIRLRNTSDLASKIGIVLEFDS